MDDIIGEIGRGFLRAIGYIIAEIVFGTVCYWIGWPICKLITFGKYPSSNQVVYLDDYNGNRENGFWCSAVGLIVLISSLLYFGKQFT